MGIQIATFFAHSLTDERVLFAELQLPLLDLVHLVRLQVAQVVVVLGHRLHRERRQSPRRVAAGERRVGPACNANLGLSFFCSFLG